jgi:hypothetical protein
LPNNAPKLPNNEKKSPNNNQKLLFTKNINVSGEPLWLSGKVVKMRKLMKSRGPGFAPHPGIPLLKKY